MTSRHPPHIDRAVRIELLRARAAVERDALASQFTQAGRSLRPAAFLRGLSGMPASSLLAEAVSLLRRYPFLLSSLPTLLAVGRRSRLFKLAGLGVAAWQAWRFVRRPGRRTSGATR